MGMRGDVEMISKAVARAEKEWISNLRQEELHKEQLKTAKAFKLSAHIFVGAGLLCCGLIIKELLRKS
jgi:hypothetical protein